MPLVFAEDLKINENKVLNFTYNESGGFYLNGSLDYYGNSYLFHQNEGLYNLTVVFESIERHHNIEVVKELNIIDKLIDLKREVNGICDGGEVVFIDEDCELADFYSQGWFYKVLAILLIIGLAKKRDQSLIIIFILLVALLFILPQSSEPIDLNNRFNNDTNETLPEIPHIDLEESTLDKSINYISGLGKKVYEPNEFIGWLIILAVLSGIYILWEASIIKGINWLLGKR